MSAPEEFMGLPAEETTALSWNIKLDTPVPGWSGTVADVAGVWRDMPQSRRPVLPWDPRGVEGAIARFALACRSGSAVGSAEVLAAFYVASLMVPGVDEGRLERFVFGFQATSSGSIGYTDSGTTEPQRKDPSP